MKVRKISKPFTKEQDEWLKQHHKPDVYIKDLTATFNIWFGESRSGDTMKNHCRIALGLKQKSKKYTAEMDKWLVAHSGLLSAKEMAEQFNAKFNQNRTEGTIKVHCNRDLHIRFSNNKFNSSMPIGTEVKRGRYLWVKVSDNKPKEGEQSGWINWKPKSHIVWQQHYGTLPEKGKIIIFLDSNYLNTDISNLYAVNGKVAREMSKKQWWSENPTITLAAIKWCELFYTIKETTKESVDKEKDYV